MFKKFITFLNNMKVRNKLVLIYCIIGIIPMLVMVSVSSYLMSDLLRGREEQNLKTYLKQAAYSVDSELATYNNMSNYITFNEIIARVLVARYSNSYDLYEQVYAVIKPQLDMVIYFGGVVKRATLYVDVGGKKFDEYIVPLAEIKDEYWYKTVCRDVDPHWYVDKDENIAFCVRRSAMLKKSGVLGLFYVSADYEKLFKSLTYNMGKNYGMFVVDADDNVIYETCSFDKKYQKYHLEYGELKNLAEDSEYKVLCEKLEQVDWSLYLYKPDKSIISDTQPITVLTTVVIAVGGVAFIVGLVWMSKFITRRLSYLRNGMVSAEEGDFSIRLEEAYTDEIGEVIRGYNTLLGKIQTLITEVYESEIAQKKYEMKALQNQINPHFLYNTLSLINWKAIENGNKDISEITLALSHFYRTSLNKGKNVLPIADELKNVKSYIAVQLFMHDYEFDVEYDIDEEIMQYESLNLILQPIVENAIEHGLDVMVENKRGLIIIKGWIEEDNIYISVTDNGVGMDEQKAANIITQHSKGYGMRNVNERIHLFYGEEYGLSVKSQLNKGTTITVKIPLKCVGETKENSL